MLRYLTRLIKNRQGFTLIELMVVIVILGILAGAAVMTLGGDTTDEAAESRVRADLRTIISALELYRIQEGDYPAAAAADVWIDTTTPDDSALADLVGDYIKSIPSPPNGWTYDYVYVAASGDYTLTATPTTGSAITDEDL